MRAARPRRQIASASRALAQGQQVEIQHQLQVAEGVLKLGVAVLPKPQADAPQGRAAGARPRFLSSARFRENGKESG
jgi:hypothetical protein